MTMFDKINSLVDELDVLNYSANKKFYAPFTAVDFEYGNCIQRLTIHFPIQYEGLFDDTVPLKAYITAQLLTHTCFIVHVQYAVIRYTSIPTIVHRQFSLVQPLENLHINNVTIKYMLNVGALDINQARNVLLPLNTERDNAFEQYAVEIGDLDTYMNLSDTQKKKRRVIRNLNHAAPS